MPAASPGGGERVAFFALLDPCTSNTVGSQYEYVDLSLSTLRRDDGQEAVRRTLQAAVERHAPAEDRRQVTHLHSRHLLEDFHRQLGHPRLATEGGPQIQDDCVDVLIGQRRVSALWRHRHGRTRALEAFGDALLEHSVAPGEGAARGGKIPRPGNGALAIRPVAGDARALVHALAIGAAG